MPYVTHKTILLRKPLSRSHSGSGAQGVSVPRQIVHEQYELQYEYDSDELADHLEFESTEEGEVDDASILANKETTKSYWEAKLLEAAENQKNLLLKNIAADSLTQAIASSVGPSAANMLVTPDSKPGRIEPVDMLDSKDMRNGTVVSPPPEFRLENKASAAGELDRRQYVYGENGELESPSSAIPRHVNIIEQEIREQQLREAQLRREAAIQSQQLDIDTGTEADDEGHDREFEDSGCAEFPEFDPTAPVVTPVVKVPVIIAAASISTPMLMPTVVRPASPTIDDDTGIESVGTPTSSTPAADPLADDLSPPSTYFDPCQYSTEAKIALEIRELKEREEELRRMRTRFQSGGNNMHSQDNLISLPTSHSTDEGNCSEYGSGEDASNKEVASIEGGGSSRLTSPEIPSNGLGFLHQRTQSMDSVSSGHSSTPSNGVAHPTPGMALSASYADFYSKRRVTVKPLADPDDEEESSYKPLKETPMEREIRLARDREEELRRIRAYQASIQQAKASKPTTPTVAKTHEKDRQGFDFNGKTEVYAGRELGFRQKSFATNRIQQEIAEQEEREKSLMLHHTDTPQIAQDEKMILSHDCEQAKEEQEQPAKKVSVSETDSVPKVGFVKSPTAANNNSVCPTTANNRGARRLVGYAGLHKLINPPAAPIGTPSTKGLMEKFLASRGKITAGPTFSTTDSVNKAAKVPAARPVVAKPDPLATVPKVEEDQGLRRQQSAGAAKPKQVIRRAFATAEEKIQQELQEMKMREKELRDQRMKALARSQPNLLAAFDDEEEESDGEDVRSKNGYPRLCDNGIMNGGSSMPQRCQSNPNLLDDDAASTVSDASCTNYSSQQGGSKTPRRKSALIAQWESMIQQQTGATINEDN